MKLPEAYLFVYFAGENDKDGEHLYLLAFVWKTIYLQPGEPNETKCSGTLGIKKDGNMPRLYK